VARRKDQTEQESLYAYDCVLGIDARSKAEADRIAREASETIFGKLTSTKREGQARLVFVKGSRPRIH
jgi:hypothetical protein